MSFLSGLFQQQSLTDFANSMGAPASGGGASASVIQSGTRFTSAVPSGFASGVAAATATRGFGTALEVGGNVLDANAAASAAQAQAILERQRAEDAARNRKRDAQRLISSQRSKFSASGVRIEGTPLLVMSETLSDAEDDILNIERNAGVTMGSFARSARDKRSSAVLKSSAAGLKFGRTLLT